ncbi:hypothetical protein LCL90_18920 [Bacillus infantis]|uniref:hypothetical protein n=1 Tax=Bacillus infantis TaxID=324767 RepID=UPI001CD53081|nr:hypothetical protein [Bacillus infantis]MCA1036719.1 hypothetical protein [Bacillus infantis]
MKKFYILHSISCLAFLFVLWASFLSPVSESGDNRQMNETLFQPAPYAFSIWGLIYVLIAIWLVRGFLSSGDERELYRDTAPWFSISAVLSGLSITAGLAVKGLDAILLIASLAALCMVYVKIKKSQYHRTFFRVPFSFYLGWTSIAVIVIIFQQFTDFGIGEFLAIGELGWTNIMLIAGALLAIGFMLLQKDIIYPLVFIWGYIGIAVEQRGQASVVWTAAAACILIAAAGLIYIFRKNNKAGNQAEQKV